MPSIAVRPAAPDDLPAVAALRWRWCSEGRDDAPSDAERALFTGAFTSWAERAAATHTCFVVVDGSAVVGMAWLAETQRPPSPGSSDRRSGDLQSVYVVPELRGQGWGGRLVAHVLAGAAARGLEHVTVHASAASTSLYLRAGFADDPRLLMTEC